MPAQLPQISIEQVGPLDAAAEVDLLLAAHASGRANAWVRNRLVELLLELDRFDEVIALLGGDVAELDFELCLALTKACFFTRKADVIKATLALRAAECALSRSTDNEMRARALCDRGKALFELGRAGEGADCLQQSFFLDRHSIMPFKRYAMHLLREGEFAGLEAITASMIAEGMLHANIISARVLALAGLNQTTAARELAGFDRFTHKETIEAPSNWLDLAAFNAQLADEIRTNPGMRFERFGTASQHTWRVDAPSRGRTPAIHALLEAIAALATRWIAALPQDGHHWLAARPQALELNCWCVITGPEGFERWHFHPAGWISGSYYVEVPAAVAQGNDKAGCFAFGLPARDVGAEAAEQFGEALVRPSPGMLTLFPSHAQHSTHPHRAEGQRICLAFDLCPA